MENNGKKGMKGNWILWEWKFSFEIELEYYICIYEMKIGISSNGGNEVERGKIDELHKSKHLRRLSWTLIQPKGFSHGMILWLADISDILI